MRWLRLPNAGPGRIAWIVLFTTILCLKFLAIFHYRVDTDETQHAHVVWAWTHGLLPYRDVFDNHMPLFQWACAPLFRLFGEHAYILVQFRFVMLLLYLVCIWGVFKLADALFPQPLAPWAALCAAALPKFFYTSTEFRTDDLWAVFWLLSLVIALTGNFTLKRAFAFSLLIGLAFAVSLKTVLLVASIGIATAVALGLAMSLGRESIPWKRIPLYLIVILCGLSIIPAAIVSYFAAKGAFWIMYYCVLQHNIVPGLRTWRTLRLGPWIFPISVPFLVGLGVLAYRQTPDRGTAIRRAILVMTPCIYAALLFSYWREITREDDLPYVPLLPLVAIPLILWLQQVLKNPRYQSWLLFPGLPAICAMEILCVWQANPLRTNRVQGTTHTIEDVLLLSKPGDYVMDNKGDYIFRPRPFYWVLEPVTQARFRQGLIKDNLGACLVRTKTRLSYFYSEHSEPQSALFITMNYMPFDLDALDLGVAARQLGKPSADGTFSFDVAIPLTYAIVSESGDTAGILDGAPYAGPVLLQAGHHTFRRTSGTGRAAFFLADALSLGFRPLFDQADRILDQEQRRIHKVAGKTAD